MEGKCLKKARELLEVNKAMCDEREGWEYLFNEGEVIATKKPDPHNHPFIRSQGYVLRSPQEIVDFIINPSNAPRWNKLLKTVVEEDVMGKSGNVHYKKVVMGFHEGPEDLDREVEYYRCLLKDDMGAYLIAYTDGDEPSTTGKLKSYFTHFNFLVTTVGKSSAAACSKVTFLWQSKTEGSYRPENIARIMKAMGEYVRNVKVALDPQP